MAVAANLGVLCIICVIFFFIFQKDLNKRNPELSLIQEVKYKMAKKRKKSAKKKAASACKGYLNPKALALAGGIIWGLAILLIGILAMYGYGMPFVKLFASVYKGYAATWGGAVVGGLWGFVDGLIGCYIFAWLYNKFC